MLVCAGLRSPACLWAAVTCRTQLKPKLGCMNSTSLSSSSKVWMSPSKRSRRSMYCTCTGQGCREDRLPPPPSLVDFPAGHHCFGPLRCKEGPTYLHSHSGAIMQPGTVHLGQAGSSDWLVVKFLKELVGRGLEVFKEQLVHLTGEGT